MADRIEPALSGPLLTVDPSTLTCADCGGPYGHTFAECVQQGGMVNGQVEGVPFHLSKGSDGVVVETPRGRARVRVVGPPPGASDQSSYSVSAEILD